MNQPIKSDSQKNRQNREKKSVSSGTLPLELSQRLQSVLGDDFASVMQAFSTERVSSFRTNTLKATDEQIISECKNLNIPIEPFTNIPHAFVVDRSHEYALKGSQLFREGLIYLQSLSSMLPVLALEWKGNEKVLDVCAAPGSKTTQIAALTDNSVPIFALEQNQIRADVLRHNLELQWAKSVELMKIEASKFLKATHRQFDVVVLDAPCSAEGRIRLSDERTYGFFSLDNIAKKTTLQLELLELAFDCLKPGWKLVYSTCTIAPEENEGVVQALLNNKKNARILPVWLPKIPELREGLSGFDGASYAVELRNTVRILPSLRFEWFYVAMIGKDLEKV